MGWWKRFSRKGKVWTITTDGIKPQGDFTVVSTLNMGAIIQYCVVGEITARAGAVPTAPSLEDSDVWLMREKRSPSAAFSVFP